MKIKHTMMALLATSIVANAATVLIDPTTRNGSFELSGGVAATAKATAWDTDPDGDVDNWTQWAGPAGDSGTDAAGRASDGTRIAFIQTGNQVYNLTGHTIAVGDFIEFSWDHVFRANVDHKGGLVSEDGGTVSFFAETGATITIGTGQTALQTYSGSYTVLAGDTALIGKQLGFGFEAIGGYPEVDNVILQVTPVPEPSSTVLLGLGGLALILRRRK